MAKAFSSALIAQLDLTVTRPGFFVRIDYNGQLTHYFSSIGDIIWDSKLWLARELRVQLSASNGRASRNVTVGIGNDSQSMTATILTHGIAGKRMRVWLVYAGATASGDPYLEFDGACLHASITPSLVTIPASIEEAGLLTCPRKRINKASGINALLPTGTRLTIGTTTFVIERRRS